VTQAADRPHPPLPEEIRAAVRARYGRDHVHAGFDPARAALVVVDMQRAFLRPEIGYVPCEAARAAIPVINDLATAVRAAGQPVIWLKNIHDAEMQRSWAGMYAMHGEKASLQRAAALSADVPGFALDDALNVTEGDLTVIKRRYSAFYPGASDLEALLATRNVETIILTGCTTDVCVESTARDAMMRDYRVIVGEDGTGSLNDAAHHNALGAMAMHFADVMPSALVLGHFNPA